MTHIFIGPMSWKRIALLIFGVGLSVGLIYMILLSPKQPPSQPMSSRGAGQDSTAIAEIPYYESQVESPEAPELAPAVWTLESAQPEPLPTRVWKEEEKPTIAEIPDSLTWNFFDRATRRAFTGKEKGALESHGFYLEEIPPLNDIQYDDMIDLYVSHRVTEYGNDYSTVPLFVSSDFLLHVYHVVFDRALQQAEERKLYFQVLDLTRSMAKVTEDECHSNSSNAVLHQALLDNLAFFNIAGRLLDTSFAVYPDIRGIVESELRLIGGAAGVSPSPLFQMNEDYSQYKPRGHYTKNKRLEGYFQAMMWYGRQSFPLESTSLTVRALLQVHFLEDTHIANLWSRITRTIGYLIGTSDDLTCEDYLRLARKVYGARRWNLEDYIDTLKLSRFMQEASQLRAPKIVDHPGNRTAISEDQKRSYRFMGQRFTPDALIFTRLTSPRVGTDAQPRNVPTALDVMTVLGSPAADELLNKRPAVPGYETAVRKLKSEFAAYPDNTWTQSVYWKWLNTLRSVLSPKGENYPYCVRTKHWSRKSLLTALGSWTELKHDTMLFSKQSGAEMGEGDEGPPPPPQPKSYVEPDVEFFNRLVDLIQSTAKVFSDNLLLSEEYLRKFSLLFNRVTALRDIAKKELLNVSITKDEYQLLLDFADDIRSIVIPEGSGDIIDQKYKQMALVADVHADFFGGQVLEEAIGSPQRIYVAVKDNPGGTRVCVGYVYRYYEFTQPLDRRMTDEEWKAMIYPVTKPEIKKREPEWVGQLRIH